MDNKRGACLVCGKPLQYFETERELTCALCGKTFSSSASCMDGHYVCDECHARQGVEVILEHCKKSASRDPVALAREIEVSESVRRSLAASKASSGSKSGPLLS